MQHQLTPNLKLLNFHALLGINNENIQAPNAILFRELNFIQTHIVVSCLKVK